MGFISAAFFFGLGYVCAKPATSRVSATGLVKAPAKEVYALFADPSKLAGLSGKSRLGNVLLPYNGERAVYTLQTKLPLGLYTDTQIVANTNEQDRKIDMSFAIAGSQTSIQLQFVEASEQTTRVEVTGVMNGTWLSNRVSGPLESDVRRRILAAEAVYKGSSANNNNNNNSSSGSGSGASQSAWRSTSTGDFQVKLHPKLEEELRKK